MIYAIFGSIIVSIITCVSAMSFFVSGESDDELKLCSYKPSLHFQIHKKSGGFIPISDLLKIRNELFNSVIKAGGYKRYVKINNR